jgi:hypothetical protein
MSKEINAPASWAIFAASSVALRLGSCARLRDPIGSPWVSLQCPFHPKALVVKFAVQDVTITPVVDA